MSSKKKPKGKFHQLLEEIGRRDGMTSRECQRFVYGLTHPGKDYDAPRQVFVHNEDPLKKGSYVDWYPGIKTASGKPIPKPFAVGAGFWATHLWGDHNKLKIWCIKGDDKKWRLKPGKELKPPFYRDTEAELVRLEQLRRAGAPDHVLAYYERETKKNESGFWDQF